MYIIIDKNGNTIKGVPRFRYENQARRWIFHNRGGSKNVSVKDVEWIEYPQQNGSGKFWLVLIILIIIAGAAFVMFGDRIPQIQSIHSKVFNKDGSIGISSIIRSNPSKFRIVMEPPAKENVWCKIQEVAVGSKDEDPARDRIIGWDNLDKCCVREISGYNCALKRESVTRFCYTGNIGAIVRYVQVDGYFKDPAKYKEYVDDYDKIDLGKTCDLKKY